MEGREIDSDSRDHAAADLEQLSGPARTRAEPSDQICSVEIAARVRKAFSRR